jgi:hypothetical protein
MIRRIANLPFFPANRQEGRTIHAGSRSTFTRGIFSGR